MEKSHTPGILHTIAFVVLLAGAIASLCMTLQAGRTNDSFLLIFLFAVWVLSPFVALLVLLMVSRNWKALRRRMLYYLILFIALGSMLGYSGLLGPIGTKHAFVFEVIPLISWLLIVIIQTISAFLSRMLTRMKDNI